MPHLNALEAKYGREGLSVVGVTDGERDKTEPWIRQLGVRYAYAYDATGYAYRTGVEAYPHALLVSPAGLVVWRGHPHELDEDLIEQHLGDALDVPLFAWPAPLHEVAAAAADGRWAEAEGQLAARIEAAPELGPWRQRLDRLVDQQIAALDRLRAAGDCFHAWARAHALRDHLAESSVRRSGVAERIDAWQQVDGFAAGFANQQRIRALAEAAFDTTDAAVAGRAELDGLARIHGDDLIGREARLASDYLGRLLKIDYFK